jgi:uncharacterized membrane protein (DUF485 family)
MTNEAKDCVQQDGDRPDWSRIAGSDEFKDLIAVKKTFILPAFVFFFVYYLALALLVGYAPKLASLRVIGTVNLGYLLALSQFAVGWIIAGLYLLASSKFDRLTNDIFARVNARQEGK